MWINLILAAGSWQMKFDYKATIGVIEDPQRSGSSVGKASITHSFSSKETNVAVERNSCDQGKTWRDMTGTFVSETTISGQGREDANVHIGVNSDGTYAISVGIPQIKGMLTGSESSTFSGQCTPKPGKNRTMGPGPTTIEGQSLTSDGSHRVDPSNPTRLSGSYSLSIAGVVETITWNLQKNAAELRILDLQFEDMKYPTWDAWQEIAEQTGTVDGNWVRIKATVFNGGGAAKTGEVYIKETYKGDKWDGARPDVPLKNQTFTVALDAGEQREVEMLDVAGQKVSPPDQKIGLAHETGRAETAPLFAAECLRIVSRLTPVISEMLCCENRVFFASKTAKSIRPVRSKSPARDLIKPSTKSGAETDCRAIARRNRWISRSMSLKDCP